MTFSLPEDDRDFLAYKKLPHRLLSEKVPGGDERRGVVLEGRPVPDNLRPAEAGSQIPPLTTDVLVLIPPGYATTKLDSFYTGVRLVRIADGNTPQNAEGHQELFGITWQFWSRHLANEDWRPGIDSLATYLQYINAELRRA